MKAVILAGGLGTRISEETQVRPKPMIEIGGHPVLWHIMKSYAHYGITDFIVCCGYRGYMIKEYFANYALHNTDVTIDFKTGRTTVHQNSTEPWTVTLVDTGDKTQTGGRLKRVRDYVGDEDFCFTYGDGLSDVNIADVIAMHRQKGTQATLTAVQPPGRFGVLGFDEQKIVSFEEKPQGDGSWINGGYFVLSPAVFDLLPGDDTIWEREPLGTLGASGELTAYLHRGFWQPMDTMRDKLLLEDLWATGRAPWRSW